MSNPALSLPIFPSDGDTQNCPLLSPPKKNPNEDSFCTHSMFKAFPELNLTLLNYRQCCLGARHLSGQCEEAKTLSTHFSLALHPSLPPPAPTPSAQGSCSILYHQSLFHPLPGLCLIVVEVLLMPVSFFFSCLSCLKRVSFLELRILEIP